MPGIVPSGSVPPLTHRSVGGHIAPLAHYGFQNIRQLWIVNGGDPRKASIAAAVAMAESGGRPNAVSHNPDGNQNKGLWQVDTVNGDAGSDPDAQAKLAIKVSHNGQNWSLWQTYAEGTYKKFLPGTALDQAGDTLSKLPVVKQVSDVAGFVGKLGVIFQADWWKRVGLIFLGLFLMGLAAVYMGRTFIANQLSGGLVKGLQGGQ
jgi:hypothetical protein